MKTLAQTALLVLTFAATTALAGPGGNAAPAVAARQFPATAKAECKSMLVQRAPKAGGPANVACTKAVQGTLACRLACN